MSSELLLGVDIGTLGSKGVLIDTNGRVLAEHFIEHGINVVRPGWIEQDPEACYWQDFKAIVRYLLRASKSGPRDIAAVGVSSLSPDVVAIDKAGKPIRPCMIYMDRRAEKECEWVKENVGSEKVFELTANAIDSYFSGYKAMWYLNHEPENFRKTWKILNANEYVIHKLTGKAAIDYGTATIFAPFFDYKKKKWSDEMCQLVKMDIDKLPTPCEAHDVVGEVTREGEETELAVGTPVVAGGADAMQSALSVGVLNSGESCFTYGTTSCWIVAQDEPRFDPRFVNAWHQIPGKYISAAAMVTTGALIRWFRDQFGQPEKRIAESGGESAYKLLDEQAEKIPPGSDGLITLPYFAGERTPIWDARAKGLIFGLTLYHTRAHVYRSILEAAGYGLKQHMKIAKEVGIRVNKMIAVDGGAKSRLWRQIISDITGFPQQYVPEAPGAPLADAFVAGLGAGLFKAYSKIKEFVTMGEGVIPNQSLHDQYSKLQVVYENLYPHTKADADQIHTFTAQQAISGSQA
jgi:sugar (pentulose or hexulose) kinase